MQTFGFHHVALAVADFDAVLKFYTEGMGFKFVRSWVGGEGTKRVAMVDIGDGGILEIFSDGNKEEPVNAHFKHFAFKVSDARAAYAQAIAAGATSNMEPTELVIASEPPLPVCIAFVNGLSGELLEFFQEK